MGWDLLRSGSVSNGTNSELFTFEWDRGFFQIRIGPIAYDWDQLRGHFCLGPSVNGTFCFSFKSLFKILFSNMFVCKHVKLLNL